MLGEVAPDTACSERLSDVTGRDLRDGLGNKESQGRGEDSEEALTETGTYTEGKGQVRGKTEGQMGEPLLIWVSARKTTPTHLQAPGVRVVPIFSAFLPQDPPVSST